MWMERQAANKAAYLARQARRDEYRAREAAREQKAREYRAVREQRFVAGRAAWLKRRAECALARHTAHLLAVKKNKEKQAAIRAAINFEASQPRVPVLGAKWVRRNQAPLNKVGLLPTTTTPALMSARRLAYASETEAIMATLRDLFAYMDRDGKVKALGLVAPDATEEQLLIVWVCWMRQLKLGRGWFASWGFKANTLLAQRMMHALNGNICGVRGRRNLRTTAIVVGSVAAVSLIAYAGAWIGAKLEERKKQQERDFEEFILREARKRGFTRNEKLSKGHRNTGKISDKNKLRPKRTDIRILPGEVSSSSSDSTVTVIRKRLDVQTSREADRVVKEITGTAVKGHCNTGKTSGKSKLRQKRADIHILPSKVNSSTSDSTVTVIRQRLDVQTSREADRVVGKITGTAVVRRLSDDEIAAVHKIAQKASDEDARTSPVPLFQRTVSVMPPRKERDITVVEEPERQGLAAQLYGSGKLLSSAAPSVKIDGRGCVATLWYQITGSMYEQDEQDIHTLNLPWSGNDSRTKVYWARVSEDDHANHVSLSKFDGCQGPMPLKDLRALHSATRFYASVSVDEKLLAKIEVASADLFDLEAPTAPKPIPLSDYVSTTIRGNDQRDVSVKHSAKVIWVTDAMSVNNRAIPVHTVMDLQGSRAEHSLGYGADLAPSGEAILEMETLKPLATRLAFAKKKSEGPLKIFASTVRAFSDVKGASYAPIFERLAALAYIAEQDMLRGQDVVRTANRSFIMPRDSVLTSPNGVRARNTANPVVVTSLNFDSEDIITGFNPAVPIAGRATQWAVTTSTVVQTGNENYLPFALRDLRMEPLDILQGMTILGNIHQRHLGINFVGHPTGVNPIVCRMFEESTPLVFLPLDGDIADGALFNDNAGNMLVRDIVGLPAAVAAPAAALQPQVMAVPVLNPRRGDAHYDLQAVDTTLTAMTLSGMCENPVINGQILPAAALPAGVINIGTGMRRIYANRNAVRSAIRLLLRITGADQMWEEAVSTFAALAHSVYSPLAFNLPCFPSERFDSHMVPDEVRLYRNLVRRLVRMGSTLVLMDEAGSNALLAGVGVVAPVAAQPRRLIPAATVVNGAVCGTALIFPPRADLSTIDPATRMPPAVVPVLTTAAIVALLVDSGNPGAPDRGGTAFPLEALQNEELLRAFNGMGGGADDHRAQNGWDGVPAPAGTRHGFLADLTWYSWAMDIPLQNPAVQTLDAWRNTPIARRVRGLDYQGQVNLLEWMDDADRICDDPGFPTWQSRWIPTQPAGAAYTVAIADTLCGRGALRMDGFHVDVGVHIRQELSHPLVLASVNQTRRSVPTGFVAIKEMVLNPTSTYDTKRSLYADRYREATCMSATVRWMVDYAQCMTFAHDDAVRKIGLTGEFFGNKVGIASTCSPALNTRLARTDLQYGAISATELSYSVFRTQQECAVARGLAALTLEPTDKILECRTLFSMPESFNNTLLLSNHPLVSQYIAGTPSGVRSSIVATPDWRRFLSTRNPSIASALKSAGTMDDAALLVAFRRVFASVGLAIPVDITIAVKEPGRERSRSYDLGGALNWHHMFYSVLFPVGPLGVIDPLSYFASAHMKHVEVTDQDTRNTAHIDGVLQVVNTGIIPVHIPDKVHYYREVKMAPYIPRHDTKYEGFGNTVAASLALDGTRYRVLALSRRFGDIDRIDLQMPPQTRVSANNLWCQGNGIRTPVTVSPLPRDYTPHTVPRDQRANVAAGGGFFTSHPYTQRLHYPVSFFNNVHDTNLEVLRRAFDRAEDLVAVHSRRRTGITGPFKDLPADLPVLSVAGQVSEIQL